MASSTSFLKILTTIASAIAAVFRYLLARHKTKNDKNLIKEKEIEKTKSKITKICDEGSISDLIDATLEIKRIKNK